MRRVKKFDAKMLAIWLLGLCAYAAVLFLLPIKRNSVFGITFVASLVIYVLVALAYVLSFMHDSALESKVLGFPIFRVALYALIIQLAIGSALMITSAICPVWLALLGEILVVIGTVIYLIATEAARGVVVDAEEKQEDTARTIKRLRAKVNAIQALQEDVQVKKAISVFADDLRYSDPVSCNESKGLERQLEVLVAQMNEGASEARLLLIKQAREVLVNRNCLVRQNKK